MIGLRKRTFFRIVAFILVGILVIQGEGFVMAAVSQEQVQEQKGLENPLGTDKIANEFENAKKLYFSEDYEAAKEIMEQLVVDLENIEGREIFKGEANLLLGAIYEKLDYKKLSIRYYCVAKDLLGKDKTFEGLDLKELKWYKKKCPATGVVPTVGARRKKGGSIIGTLLGLALLGGLIWYLFINENSPIKSKDEDEDPSAMTQSELYANYCVKTYWLFSSSAKCSSLPGCEVSLWYRLPDMTWEKVDSNISNSWAPEPGPTNNFKGEKRLKIKESAQVISSTWEFKLDVVAGNGITRQDIIKVDGVEKLNVTNTFNNDCGNTDAFKKSYTIYTGGGEKTFTITHELILSYN